MEGMAVAHLRMTTDYEVPIEHVFDLAVDYKRYPEWNVSYEEVTEVVGPPDQVGAKMHGVMKLLGRKVDILTPTDLPSTSRRNSAPGI